MRAMRNRDDEERDSGCEKASRRNRSERADTPVRESNCDLAGSLDDDPHDERPRHAGCACRPVKSWPGTVASLDVEASRKCCSPRASDEHRNAVAAIPAVDCAQLPRDARSEERRVGKEG